MKNTNIIKSLVVIATLTSVAASTALTPSNTVSAKTVKPAHASVGILQFVTHPALDQITKGIKEGLKEEGYGKAKIHFYNGEADQSKLTTMSQKLVSENNNVLIGVATPAAQSLANATSKTPVFMGAVTDPVGAKLVKNVKKPEGNVTGVSDRFPVKKELKLIKKIMPHIKTLGVLYSSSEANSKSTVKALEKAAPKYGIKVKEYAASSTNDISTLTNVASSKVQALYIPNDNTVASAFDNVLQITDKAKIPVFPSVDTMVNQGGLAGVTINQRELGIQTGKMAAKILEGKKVKKLPVNFYDSVKPVVNTKEAAKLGIKIPSKIVKESVK